MFGRDGGTRTHSDTVRSRAVFQLAYTSIKRLVNYAFSVLRRPLHFLLLLYNPLFNKAIPTFNSFSHGHTPKFCSHPGIRNLPYWGFEGASNSRPIDYEPIVLPTELSKHLALVNRFRRVYDSPLKSAQGIIWGFRRGSNP